MMNNDLHDSEDLDEEEQIFEFARYIGIDPDNEQYLMYLAEEGFSAQTPKPWVQCVDEQNNTFYFNKETNECMTDSHPNAEIYKSKVIVERQRRMQKAGFPKIGLGNPFGAKQDDTLLVAEKMK